MLFILAYNLFVISFQHALEFGQKGAVMGSVDDHVFALSSHAKLKLLYRFGWLKLKAKK